MPVDVVLVRPSRPANVAAACRAMKNMGLRTLWLVEPPPGLERPEARALAHRAWDVLDGARSVGDLRHALAGASFVAGTCGRPGAGSWSPRRLAREAPGLIGEGRLAIVFGPESSGLSNRELGMCHSNVHIPTDPAQPSLNLAQAVLLICYELRLAGLDPAALAEEPQRASVGEMEEVLTSLTRGLLGIGYLNPQNPHGIIAELRGLLARAQPTSREVNLLRGLAHQVEWAAGRIAAAIEADDNRASRETKHAREG